MAKKPKKAEAEKPKRDDSNGAFIKEAIKRYDAGYEREEANIIEAYDDLEFLAGNHWPAKVKADREEAQRPVLTINRVPQFVRQVTGDIRQMRPSIKCVPVDNRGDKETAEVLAGMIRYIENRSDAEVAYTSGADSQVACGVGHWRVTHEYAEDTTFNQELRIISIPDGVSVIWDPDAQFPNKEDAKWCFVPVDMSRRAYEAAYPDAPITDFVRETFAKDSTVRWYGEDFVRVAEYWEKRPEKRTLALMPDGSVDDLTDGEGITPEYMAELKAKGARIEQRDGYCVYRSLVTLGHVLEDPVKWPGRYIPIVRAAGEEYRVGRKQVRHGVVRFMKDPQRAYNYFRSTQTEVVALQPKAPFIGTEKNFEGFESMWTTANTKNWPWLPYNPDPKNGSHPPQRSSPAVPLAGIEEGMLVSSEEMKSTTGIYDASLGAKSNETSGRAIMARQREGDVGTFVYISNFSRAVRHTGRILVDLIPHIYDTERQIRIIGEDGKEDLVQINRPMLDQTVPGQMMGEESDMQAQAKVMHDVTVGAYDVVLETGPSYSTKRAEARDSMIEFMRSAPDIAPVVLDLVAEAQDWPGADKFAKRVKHLLPPAIRAEEAQEAGEPIPPDAQPPQPNPMEMMELQGKQLDNQGKELANAGKELDLAAKQQGMVHAEVKSQQPQQPAQQPQPAQGAVTEAEFQHFAQVMFSAVEQLQAQVNQLAQMAAPPMPSAPEFIPPEEQPGQVPGF